MSKYYWKMVVKRGEVEKILEELEQAKKTIYECYSKLWEFDSIFQWHLSPCPQHFVNF